MKILSSVAIPEIYHNSRVVSTGWGISQNTITKNGKTQPTSSPK